MSNFIKKALESLVNEGVAKKSAEEKVEKACTCDGGASLDPNEHTKNCPARKVLKEMGL